MYYIIERVTDLPFDKSTKSIQLEGSTYDIVSVPRNTALDSVSEFIIDENNVVVKSDPRLELSFRLAIEDAMGIQLQELLFG